MRMNDRIRQDLGRTPLALVASACLALAACAVNPATGERQFMLVSESQEISLGQQGAADTRQSIGLYPDSSLQAYVSARGMEIAARSERPNLPWSYQVVDDPVVNAFALPGGPVFITRGILAYFNSEAEMMSVIGHETGHITARHSAKEMSRQQLLGGLLGVGSMLSADIAKYAGVAGQGLQLLFLKYSRDDEAQADALGFRYMVADGYDPRAMARMFTTLGRLSGGAGERIPEWQSTHPDPVNRLAATEQRIKGVTTDLDKLKLDRDSYLRRIDGIVFGDDPRNGYFDGARFYHPRLKFTFVFPAGWATQNQNQAVVAISPKQDAVVVLSTAGTAAPAAAARAFLGQQGIQAVTESDVTVNGLPAHGATFTATTQNADIAGRALWVSLDGATYQILAYTTAGAYSTYAAAFGQSLPTFARLTDPARLAIQPKRIHVVKLASAQTIAQVAAAQQSAVPADQLAVINGVEAGEVLPAGTLVKVVR
jgi:predicted Zn-dependent protease